MKIDIDHRDRVVIAVALRLLSQQPLDNPDDARALRRLLIILKMKQPVPMPDTGLP